jgi:hypothetical protein
MQTSSVAPGYTVDSNTTVGAARQVLADRGARADQRTEVRVVRLVHRAWAPQR